MRRGVGEKAKKGTSKGLSFKALYFRCLGPQVLKESEQERPQWEGRRGRYRNGSPSPLRQDGRNQGKEERIGKGGGDERGKGGKKCFERREACVTKARKSSSIKSERSISKCRSKEGTLNLLVGGGDQLMNRL